MNYLVDTTDPLKTQCFKIELSNKPKVETLSLLHFLMKKEVGLQSEPIHNNTLEHFVI